MGASRKLQGEIDRVLKKVQEGVDVFDSIWNKVYDTDNANQKEKFEADLKKEIKKLQRYRDQIKTWIQSSEIKDKKVSASYEQALMDSRKLIEREMERFKICEKETKTKAFSKEGLGQQPKTDPKEKAKSETRDWLNNVVSELESQIDSFEAEMEGLTVKKGKTRPPRLTHLEASITRHKAHIMKLELILRLLDNDELSPEQVNDVKDFLDDYVERNQEDFEEFSDVDELYSSLPLEKVEALEDLVNIGPPGLVKGVGATSAILSLKTSLTSSSAPPPAVVSSANQQGSSVQEQVEETASQDSTDIAPKTPSSKSNIIGASAPTTPTGSHVTGTLNTNAHVLPGASTASTILLGPSPARGVLEAAAVVSSAPISVSIPTKEEEVASSPGRKSSPALSESLRGVGRGNLASPLSSSNALGSGSTIPSNGAFGALAPSASEITKRNILSTEEKFTSTGPVQPLVSPLGNRIMLPQAAKANEMTDSGNVGETTGMPGRVFSPSVVTGMQWRPGSSFQNQNEAGQFRGRTEIAPDQREKFLQRFQQVQQGQSTMLGMPPLSGVNHKQYSSQQQNPLMQQFNSQSSATSSLVGLGVGVQAPGINTVTSASLQPQSNLTLQQQSSQHASMSTSHKDPEIGHAKVEDLQHQQHLSDDLAAESTPILGVVKNNMNEDESKTSYSSDMPAGVSGSLTETGQMPRDIDLSLGQPLQSNQSSGSLGVIGRRSVSDLGAIGDTLGGQSLNSAGMHDQLYNLQMLESAYYKLPQPKDSERAKSYIPRHPAVTPSSYPQVQAPIVNNPAFWERLGADNYGTDTLFFAFYYQQNTYQQYLAAKELKKQSWRFHKKYNTWFQRHEEPKVATDDYEQGTYVYFDFHISDESQHGWCQRIKTEFRFEYNYLEDELIV
ncbi:general negative regulator of transcription subunit 3 isoform X1 [Daucus carota subsp. sativus]|uniref:general negative regulator of transcription subunit 3 isoform X1 n=1 Tax=Daucus carota subsp. sativus TaxID=79200 RepID=UPI0007EF31A6|nr:PREDICTED: general negative regulator of transcription subunit 3 isoform X1 [Daucus carota subsp. sativus]